MNYDDVLQEFVTDELFSKSKGTIDTYLTSINQFIKWMDESGLILKSAREDKDGLTKLDIQEYIHYLEKRKKKSPKTIKKDWAAISSLLLWKGIETEKVLKKVKIPEIQDDQAPKALDDKMINKIIREEYSKADRYDNWRDYLIVILLAHFGLRIEEVVQLDLDSVMMTERKGQLTVRGKGNKTRVMPFPKTDENPKVREAFTLYLEQRLKMKTDLDALFISRHGLRLSKRAAQNVVDKYGVHCHQFRHSFITKLVDKGMSIPLIMSLTGHTSADTVARYSKPTEEKKERAMASVDYPLYDGDK